MSATLRLLDWLELIRQIRMWLSRANEILDLPDINDPSAVYGWCHTILVLARESVKLTPTEVDDRVITWLLEVPFASFDEFLPFYKVFRTILDLVSGNEPPEVIASRAMEAGGEEAVARLSNNTAGLDPISLIVLIVQVIRFILDLKRRKEQ